MGEALSKKKIDHVKVDSVLGQLAVHGLRALRKVTSKPLIKQHSMF